MHPISMKSATSGFATIAFTLALIGLPASPSFAASQAEIDKDVSAALAHLYAINPAAKTLGAKATAVLVFPSVWKAGFSGSR